MKNDGEKIKCISECLSDWKIGEFQSDWLIVTWRFKQLKNNTKIKIVFEKIC